MIEVTETSRKAFFTPQTLADYLSLSSRTVREMLRQGKIASYKIEGARRIYADDVDAYLERCLVDTRAPATPRVIRNPRDPWEVTLLLDPCSYCGGPAQHIEPRARGGDDDWTNWTPACRRCNSSKHARPVLLWLAGRRRK